MFTEGKLVRFVSKEDFFFNCGKTSELSVESCCLEEIKSVDKIYRSDMFQLFGHIISFHKLIISQSIDRVNKKV